MTQSLERLQVLRGQLQGTLRALAKIDGAFTEFLTEDFRILGEKNTSAIVIAEYLVDYYTCLETFFLRVSQHFENNLPAHRWHSELLDRMVLRIEHLREPVVDEPLLAALREIMKFRHFRRYYFELEYDWDKLKFLQAKFDIVRAGVPARVAEFDVFLQQVAAELGG